MGWTGDMQVFAKTGAYNMNIKSFIDKWLDDLIDAQTMYIKTVLFPIPPHSEVITALTVAAVGATPQRLCRGKCMKHTAIYAYLKNAMI